MLGCRRAILRSESAFLRCPTMARSAVSVRHSVRCSALSQILRNFDHSNFPKIRCSFASKMGKSRRSSQPRFQASLLGSRLNAASQRPRGRRYRGSGHAIPFANGILAWARAGPAAERRFAARRRRSQVSTARRSAARPPSPTATASASASPRPAGRFAGGGRDRASGAGRRQDAVRISQRPARTERHQRPGRPAARPASPCRPRGAPSQNTLTPADLAPTWRGPQPRRDRSGPRGKGRTSEFRIKGRGGRTSRWPTGRSAVGFFSLRRSSLGPLPATLYISLDIVEDGSTR